MLVKSKTELIKLLDECIVLGERLNAEWDTISMILKESVCCNTQQSTGANTLL